MTRRSSRKARRAIAEAAQNPGSSQPPAAPVTPPADAPAGRPGAADGRSRRRDEAAAPKARRGGSARRRRRAAGPEADAGSRRPAIGRDGKASIACPNCATRYKIAEENLETKVTCTQCHRTFFPLAAANSRHSTPDHSKPVIYGIVGVAAIVLIGILINQMSKPSPVVQPKVTHKPPVDLGSNTAEVSAVIAWGTAIGDKDAFNTELHSDMDAMQKKFGIDKKSPYSRSFGDAKRELTARIVNTLFDATETLVFRAYRPRYGRITDAKMVEDKQGTVRLSLEPRPDNPHRETAVVLVSYGYDQTSSRFKVTDWRVETMARTDYLLEKIDNKNPAKKHEKHKIIGEITRKKITFGGKEVEVTEAELVPLPHLESTSPEDRKRIDALIEKLIDLNAPGMAFNQADLELRKFQKAAVPRILNKMYETKMKTRDDIDVMNRLCRFLRLMTGERFGFNHVDMPEGTDIGGTEKERISSLKRWYAWWARYHDRDDWKNIDSDEEVELTTPEIEALRKKKAEAARKEREERRKRARGGK